MKCKHHPNRDALHYCSSCGIPICADCTEEVKPGDYYCFQCAMFRTVAGVGVTLKDKREKSVEKKAGKKIKLGPFHYFVMICSVMIVVMWGVILFGGQKPVGKPLDVDQNPRVFLFLVNNAIKRHHHYERGMFPDKLEDLVPRYMPLNKEDMVHFNKLAYRKDKEKGYTLSFVKSKPGEMKITISSEGITYTVPAEAVKNE